ncbi:MAG: bifunctional hydroxymethylpyrimidine kinase/phosphomethylpyrimidine kinase [Deltaproteobacteria bacterium]|nr:MAG: bifunctional hydroxymethylpyrimidine kinase/phosphomethylpyrimidine kinase [Deltaproteobacteria bacterium]
MKNYTKVLTIAGSDSGGGAGIQADLKTFQACGCYGMSVITAVTAQNTLGVTCIHEVPIPVISTQIAAVLEDIGVDGVKIGMLHSVEVIDCVVKYIKKFNPAKIVLDPVMVATSGDLLIQDDAVSAMKSIIFDKVSLLTPNLSEAEVILGSRITSLAELEEAARELACCYQTAVLVKGGHLDEPEVTDVYCHQGKITRFTNPRIETANTHGTGCTLSSAITAHLALGLEMEDAIGRGREFLQGAMKSGAEKKLGNGNGPVDHSYNLP